LDKKLVTTLAELLTQLNTPDNTIAIVRWLLDEICGMPDEPCYRADVREMVERIIGPLSNPMIEQRILLASESDAAVFDGLLRNQLPHIDVQMLEAGVV
jgi:hypothetical protein